MRLIFASQVPKMSPSHTKDQALWSGNQTRHGIEVSRSLIFAVGNESAKTAKIKRLENLVLYGRWR